MVKDAGATKEDIVEIIGSLEAKFYKIGTSTRWLGIALFLIGVVAAIIGAGSWSYAILIMGITIAIIGSITKYYFGPTMD
jgi:hypothetical protein